MNQSPMKEANTKSKKKIYKEVKKISPKDSMNKTTNRVCLGTN